MAVSLDVAAALSVISGSPKFTFTDDHQPVVAVAGVLMPYRMYVMAMIDAVHNMHYTHNLFGSGKAASTLRNEIQQLNSTRETFQKASTRIDAAHICLTTVKTMYSNLADQHDGKKRIIRMLTEIEDDYEGGFDAEPNIDISAMAG